MLRCRFLLMENVPDAYSREGRHKVVVGYSPVAWNRPFDPQSEYSCQALQALRMMICGPRTKKMCRMGAR